MNTSTTVPPVKEFWPQVLAELRERVPGPTFHSLLEDTTGEIGGNTVTVTAPNSYVVDMLDSRRLGDGIKQACAQVAGGPVDVVYINRQAPVLDFDTGEVLGPPPRLDELDDEGMAAWLSSIGDRHPQWTVSTFGAKRVAKFAATMFGERGDSKPDDDIEHPVRVLVYYLKQDVELEARLARPRILDIGSARCPPLACTRVRRGEGSGGGEDLPGSLDPIGIPGDLVPPPPFLTGESEGADAALGVKVVRARHDAIRSDRVTLQPRARADRPDDSTPPGRIAPHRRACSTWTI